MKYQELTKEQLEELHMEFINFLATQSITANEWDDIKTNTPEVAHDEIKVFSDLVWEGVLNKVEYIEHISPQTMNLFFTGSIDMKLISLQIKNDIDITTKDGYAWLKENLLDDDVEFLTATRKYTEDHNLDKFKLIRQGGVISKGALFIYFEDLIAGTSGS